VKEDVKDRACNTNGENRNAYRILMGKPERRRQLGRPTRKWVDNNRRGHIEKGWIDIETLFSPRIEASGGLL
jgi:hypothetical protein